ncbi:uncharacterized protein LY89DRAFT_685117 [Mollisia scopiformis]|uniref:DUF6590 domain-containing protein n=1 Tax=Mollisia scopiformis TaxID=149040 RepID=A0A194XAI8_MOLSC|nr:uncharacterized protein LY89DRAFT_685117 [Mollisia scopiformis]KUJ17188.1 hypothetical protein LY89DRAFT_685117 [Mollisia scopiformis]
MSGKQPDLSTPWSEWMWSDKHGCKYAQRYGPDGKLEYDFLEPPEEDEPEEDEHEEDPETPQYTRESTVEDAQFYTTSQPPRNRPSYGYYDDNIVKNASLAGGFPSSYYDDNIVKNASLAGGFPSRGSQHNSQPGDIGSAYEDYESIGEPPRFFKVGRVLEVIWAEPAGEDSSVVGPNFMVSQLGANVFTKNRRFVVVREMRGCCICLSLFTYNGQGTTKDGVRPEDYAAVFPDGGQAHTLPGERLSKDPFPIIIENPSQRLHPMSRLSFGRVYTVEHNVRAIKIGRIPDEHHTRLTHYLVHTIFGPQWRDMSIDFNSDNPPLARSIPPGINTGYATPWSETSTPRVPASSQRMPAQYTTPRTDIPERSTYTSRRSENFDSLDDAFSSIHIQDSSGQIKKARQHLPQKESPLLDARYIQIDERKNKRFWKVGRVFKMVWTEPARPNAGLNNGQYESVWLGETVFSEIRLFVVVGEGYGNVICSPIHTYSGQATLKPNLPDRQQHAIIYTSARPPEERWQYDTNGNVVREELTKDPIRVVRDLDDEESDLGDLARINYAKIYTIEKYVRVLNIGKVHANSMESLLASCLFVRPADQPPQGPRKATSSNKSNEDRRDERGQYRGQSSRSGHHHRRK